MALAGCATTSQKTTVAPIGYQGPQSFSTDLVVEQGQKSYKLHSDILVLSKNAIRLDVRTTLDLPLASVLLTDKEIRYALYRAKKFYSGKPGPRALDPVFPLSIDVFTLQRILNETPGADDKCTKDDVGRLKECVGKTGETKYIGQWAKRQNSGPLAGRAAKIVLDLPDRSVRLKFFINDFQSTVPNLDKLSRLDPPEGFKLFSLPNR